MNDLLSDLLDRNTKAVPSENEYIGEDGLFYCRKCHTPTQCRIEIGGRQRIVCCVCKCRREEQEEYDRKMAEMDRRSYIRSLKASGLQERALHDWKFENAADSASIQMAKRYVANWEDAKKNNLGLLLWGDVGTGKSFTAACIANALLEAGVPVLMTNFSKILNQMGGMYSDERYKYIASFSAFELLIIDDLGIERNTEYALEQVYAVIDERYKSGKPLIITTNLTIAQIRDADDVAHARIYSRVLELCTPVQVRGADRRTEIGRSKQALVKEILLGS
ncbi:MAG: ATP-binding protein [Lachnospiraceae bacterium]|nr:ATP-binding protein [Lachnospiraceae bacterium]